MAGNGGRGGASRKSGAITRKPEAARKTGAPEMSGRVKTSQLQRARGLSDEKVGRILGRLVTVTRDGRDDGRVRAANRVEVRVRAGSFIRDAANRLLKKQGPDGQVPVAEAYRFALSRRSTYGTQRQNRNRPVPYDRLLQSRMRQRAGG